MIPQTKLKLECLKLIQILDVNTSYFGQMVAFLGVYDGYKYWAYTITQRFIHIGSVMWKGFHAFPRCLSVLPAVSYQTFNYFHIFWSLCSHFSIEFNSKELYWNAFNKQTHMIIRIYSYIRMMVIVAERNLQSTFKYIHQRLCIKSTQQRKER